MKKVVLLILIFSIALSLTTEAKEKLAQTGMQFLSVSTDSRAAGMGEAVSTLNLKSTSLFFNPAAMANLGALFDVTFSQVGWIADIKINSFSAAFSPANGMYGVFGITVTSIDYGEIEGTMVWSNPQGYIDTEILKPSALAVGLGYARALSDKFSIGGQVRMVKEYLGKSVVPIGETGDYKVKKNLANAVAFDFGTLYKTGFKSLTIGMNIRNFSNEITYEDEGFQLPLTFKIGISMNLVDLMDQEKYKAHELYLSIDAIHPRSHSEQLNVGMEYGFLKTFYARFGYMYNYDEYGITYGFGITKFGVSFDYSYTPFKTFDNVQRITARYSF